MLKVVTKIIYFLLYNFHLCLIIQDKNLLHNTLKSELIVSVCLFYHIFFRFKYCEMILLFLSIHIIGYFCQSLLLIYMDAIYNLL